MVIFFWFFFMSITVDNQREASFVQNFVFYSLYHSIPHLPFFMWVLVDGTVSVTAFLNLFFNAFLILLDFMMVHFSLSHLFILFVSVAGDCFFFFVCRFLTPPPLCNTFCVCVCFTVFRCVWGCFFISVLISLCFYCVCVWLGIVSSVLCKFIGVCFYSLCVFGDCVFVCVYCV